VVRREHHADARHDDVEFGGVEGQGFGIGRRPLEAESFCGRSSTAHRQQLRRQVGRGHHGTSPGCRKGGGAGAGGDIEHALPGLHVQDVDEDAAERRDDIGHDGRVAAAGPHRGVLGLEG
jgi:hypothetical protein